MDGASYHKSPELRDYLDLVNKAKSPERWKINYILFAPKVPEKKSSRRYLATRKKSDEKNRISL